jgi:hypothetical protein
MSKHLCDRVAKNKGVLKLTQTSKTRDLPPIVTAYDMLYPKEKSTAASDGGETSRLAAKEDYTDEEYRRRH